MDSYIGLNAAVNQDRFTCKASSWCTRCSSDSASAPAAAYLQTLINHTCVNNHQSTLLRILAVTNNTLLAITLSGGYVIIQTISL